MSETTTPRTAAFFADHAGYGVQLGETIGEARARVGGQLADAHKLLAELVDAGAARVEWEFDSYPDPDDDAGTREAWEAGDVEPYCCAILTRCDCCGSFTAAASLGGIWLATTGVGRDPYCDVIEAELALEASAELRALLDAGDDPDDDPPAIDPPGRPDDYRGPDGILGNDFTGPAAAGW